MVFVKARLRRWGSSVATVIPPDVLRSEGLTEGEEVVLDIRKARTLKDHFGSLRGRRIDAQKLKDKLRAEDNE